MVYLSLVNGFSITPPVQSFGGCAFNPAPVKENDGLHERGGPNQLRAKHAAGSSKADGAENP